MEEAGTRRPGLDSDRGKQDRRCWRGRPPAAPATSPEKRRRRKGTSRRRARSKSKAPHKVLRLTTYERLDEYLRAFAKGHFHLMILVGAGGLAKSRSVRAVLSDGEACWIEGNATPFGMYAKLYRHRDQFVVIDDVDALYADRSGVRLLKCLCQTEEEKAVAWHSDARSLERQRIPREFTTKSRVVIISNDWQTLNKNVAALQDRGHVIFFQPSEGTAQIAAKICSKDAGQRTWARSNTYCPYRITLSHSMGLTCSSRATSIFSSSDWPQRTTREISLACQ